MTLLGRLKLWQKLAILVAGLLVPTILAGVFYFRTVSENVKISRAELDGARYLQPLGAVLVEVLNHRSVAHALLNGDANQKEPLQSSAARIDSLMEAVDAVDGSLNAQFRTSAQWQALKSAWSELRSRTADLTTMDSEAQHNALVDKLLELNLKVWMESGLALDPGSATYYMINAAAILVPDVMIHADGMRMRAAGAALSGHLGANDREAVLMHYHQAAMSLENVQTELASVATESAQIHDVVLPALERATRELGSFHDTLRGQATDLQSTSVKGADIYRAGDSTARALSDLSNITYAAVGIELTQRLHDQLRDGIVNGVVLAVIVLFALGLSGLITRAVVNPMAHAVSVFESISTGRYDNYILVSGTDETGQVLSALEDMQTKLRRLKDEENNATATVSGRIRAALDHATSAVLVADADLKIIYVNHVFEALVREHEAQLRCDLPQLSLTALVGSGIEVLYKSGAACRPTLQSLRGSHVEELLLGGRTFRTVASPVFIDSGQRTGTVIEWTDRTQEVAVEAQMQAIVQAVLSGDLEKRIAIAGMTGFFEVMSRGVNRLADNLTEIVSRAKHAASSVHQGAAEITQGTVNLAQRTEEQSSSLEETSSSMEEMTSSVRQNADHAQQANELAQAARVQAEKGGAVVNQAVSAMGEINEASRKIADIIGVIDDIAFQTNLLALNAAVEAARAGEQGRGFAVVASEVRSLAGRSAIAAKEIKTLIRDSVHKVQDGSALVTQSGQTLEQIVSSVKKVSAIVAEIAAASHQQATGIEQINRAVTQMDELTQQNAALVEQTTTASQAMSEHARALDEMLSAYRVDSGADHPGTQAVTRPSAAGLRAVDPTRQPRVPIPLVAVR